MLQVTAAATPQDDAEQLRLENERLRAAMAARLNALSPEKRAAVLEQHNQLRASAKAAGVEIPALVGEVRPGGSRQQSMCLRVDWPAQRGRCTRNRRRHVLGALGAGGRSAPRNGLGRYEAGGEAGSPSSPAGD